MRLHCLERAGTTQWQEPVGAIDPVSKTDQGPLCCVHTRRNYRHQADGALLTSLAAVIDCSAVSTEAYAVQSYGPHSAPAQHLTPSISRQPVQGRAARPSPAWNGKGQREAEQAQQHLGGKEKHLLVLIPLLSCAVSRCIYKLLTCLFVPQCSTRTRCCGEGASCAST